MKVRRLVTGKDEQGRSVAKWEQEIEGKTGRPGFEHLLLWATDTLPVEFKEDDPIEWEIGTSMTNGSIFRLCRYEPGVEERWHQTDSLDYGIVLSGEMWMQLESGEVHLKPGDVVVQRGTNHNWVNKGSEPCVMAFVLIATKDGESTGWS